MEYVLNSDVPILKNTHILSVQSENVLPTEV